MNKEDKNNKWDKKRLLIESAVAILCAGLGIVFGASSNVYYYNGQKMRESELNNIMEENVELISSNNSLNKENSDLQQKLEDLNIQYKEFESRNSELEAMYNELAIQSNQDIKDLKEQLNNMPIISYKNLTLCVDASDIPINTNESVVTIDGKDYFSKEIVEKLITEDKNLTIKGETIYVGKVIAERAKLTDQWVMGNVRCSIEDTSVDIHGHTYKDCIILGNTMYYNDSAIKYSVDNKYSSLKGTICVSSMSGMGNKGSVTIKADNTVVYSEELDINSPDQIIDIPINNCAIIDIIYNGNSGLLVIFSEVVLYN